MTLALARTQLAIADQSGSAKPVDKWHVWRAISETRVSLGLKNDRTIQVLRALLTFAPADILSVSDRPPIVYPSNRTLSKRAGGIPESTLRRLLNELVKAGLIIRRDSANGKRYARGSGDVRVEFGFDLSPIVVRGSEFLERAAEQQRREIECGVLREQLKACRRDVAKNLVLLEVLRSSDGLDELRARYQVLTSRTSAKATVHDLRRKLNQFLALGRDIIVLLRLDLVDAEMSASESQNERHIQDSKPSQIIKDDRETDLELEEAERAEKTAPLPSVEFTLSSVLKACPQFERFSKTGISHWGDFLQTAATVRSTLAINRSTWDEALDALGLQNASIVLAAILERAETGNISSPAAYMRALTKKASQGKFSPKPMLVALIRERMRSERLRLQATNLGISSAAIKRALE
ncbi:replication initiation protein RepC [Bradyrhizobium sp. USDA 4341]